ncbi:MAG TPA: BTAD domain-containing putative transcriptional regulator [Ktedonobacteraceae bacterium]|jgi:DNA-binding SARP family transcriptional activator
MYSANESESVEYPLVKIFTMGEFALKRLTSVASPRAEESPHYAPVSPREWGSRRPALLLLKVLLCRPNRRAVKEELIEAIWPDCESLNGAHALDSAASILRRHVLQTGEQESLLLTVRSRGETIFKLPGQCRLWVDSDAFLELAARALGARGRGCEQLPLLEAAHALSRGGFLEDDLYAQWAQRRRHTVEGARHRVLYRLVDLYLEEACVGQAEELLFAELERDATDEDALCRLMVLLVDQGRRREALQLYHSSVVALREEQSEPAMYTRDLATRIRRGLTVRERKAEYATGGMRPASTTWMVVRPALAIVAAALPDDQRMRTKAVRTSRL